jgi:ADP-heptose:LPS heptosyltransferase
VTWAGNAAYRPVVEMMGADAFLPSEALVGFDPRRFDAIVSFADVGAEALGGMQRVVAVPVRIGRAAARSRPRWFNQIVHASRLGWPRHEAQRDLRLLLPFGAGDRVPLASLWQDCCLRAAVVPMPDDLPARGHVVLHPFSMGHAREWPLEHWVALVRAIAADGRAVVLTGSAAEGERFAQAWPGVERPHGVCDAFGRLDLAQLSVLLERADALVACSTGPLHLAAALGTPVLGLYVPRKGLAMDRWAALGAAAVSMQARSRCTAGSRCQPGACACIAALEPHQVALALRPGRQPDLAALASYVTFAASAAQPDSNPVAPPFRSPS